MHLSLIFELREIYMSFPNIFSLASNAVVLDSTLGLEHSSVTTAPRPTYLNRPPLTRMSILIPSVLFVVSLVFSKVISKG